MSKKVFELANEFGLGAIDLVEKLKSNGINVRNHMVTLTPDELEKAMNMLAPVQAEVKAPVRKVVKKVVKKETTQTTDLPTEKIEAPKEIVEASVQTKSTDESKKLDNVAIKRKTNVIRKKVVEEEALEPITEPEVIDEVKPATISEHVFRSNNVEEKIQETTHTAESKKDARDKSKDYFKEKMHTFTPIYVPPTALNEDGTEDDSKKKKGPIHSLAPKQKEPAQGEAVVVVDGEEDEKDKKRFGGLAAMVSTKKVKDITAVRTEEELKSYALGVLGHAAYTAPKKKKMYSGPKLQTQITEVKESKRIIHISGGLFIHELAQKLSIRFEQMAEKVLDINLLIKKDDYVGVKLAGKISALYNYKVEDTSFKEEEIIKSAKKVTSDPSLPVRPPVIAIMGHVDHGKTSLLDYIRKAKVADGEAGGITQHIGAYQVKVKDSILTFLDTPGHAAFASMRQRGAKATDIVVLVVAADDGVMPQTKESIKYIQEAGCQMIVAVNKMDKEGANPDKVKQALMEYHITPEEWGGETQFVEVSALKGTGVDKLLDSIQIQSEMMDLRANPKGDAEAVVIESKIEIGRGPVATVLVQAGTLRKGDSIVVGETSGRARSLMDFQGKMVNEAGPSTPIQILGLETPPNPGDILNVVKNEREAQKIIDNRVNERKALAAAPGKKMSLEDFFSNSQESTGKKILKLIIRGDVQGSVEAIQKAVEVLGNNEVGVEVITAGVGPITDSDVLMAVGAKAYIFGFNMRPVTSARKLAEDKGVDVKTYSIIYELINDVTMALEGMLAPEKIEKYIGRATVKEIFNIPKIGVIAGSSVIDGKIQRACNIRLLRNGKILHDGKLATLKRFKDEVKEVQNGYECGIALENYNDIKQEDIFEAYIMEEKKRTLEPTGQTL